MNSPHEYLRSALKKYSNSLPHLTSNELIAAVKLLQPVEHTISFMGEQFRLFQYNISQTLLEFQSFLEARGITEEKQKKIWLKMQKGKNRGHVWIKNL
jgi:hypothetical protein